MLPRIPAIECAELLRWRGAEHRRWAARRSAAAKGGGGGGGRSKMEARRELGKLGAGGPQRDGAARVPLWVWVEYRKLQLVSARGRAIKFAACPLLEGAASDLRPLAALAIHALRPPALRVRARARALCSLAAGGWVRESCEQNRPAEASFSARLRRAQRGGRWRGGGAGSGTRSKIRTSRRQRSGALLADWAGSSAAAPARVAEHAQDRLGGGRLTWNWAAAGPLVESRIRGCVRRRVRIDRPRGRAGPGAASGQRRVAGPAGGGSGGDLDRISCQQGQIAMQKFLVF